MVEDFVLSGNGDENFKYSILNKHRDEITVPISMSIRYKIIILSLNY